MKRSRFFLTIGAAMMFLSGAAGAHKPKTGIQGNYVEVRSCDVYTGSCFANAEMGLTGEEAILTWSITRGSWHGPHPRVGGRHPRVSSVRLDGLNVIAVVKASATLGDRNHDPYPARSIIIVDHRANRAQREALVCFAGAMAGKLLANVVDVQVAPIKARIGACSKSGCASVSAEGLVEIETRCLGTEDHVCGNEETFYPPLTKVDNAVPALTVEGSFKGDGVGVTWSDAGRRSAFLATFHR